MPKEKWPRYYRTGNRILNFITTKSVFLIKMCVCLCVCVRERERERERMFNKELLENGKKTARYSSKHDLGASYCTNNYESYG